MSIRPFLIPVFIAEGPGSGHTDLGIGQPECHTIAPLLAPAVYIILF
jgi:hypothetical protein